MLLQSQDGWIRLLPALPMEWNEGSFSGVCARGAFELDYSWKDGKVTQLNIKSKAGETCRIEWKPGLKITSNGKTVPFKKESNGVAFFQTSKDSVYRIQ